MEFLPAYSPDFNPIERLWRWMKNGIYSQPMLGIKERYEASICGTS